MNEALMRKLTDLGLTKEQVTNLANQGVAVEDDMSYLNAKEIRSCTGCGIVVSKKIAEEFAPRKQVHMTVYP